MYEMQRARSALIAALAVVAVAVAPSAQAKFRMAVTLEPARPLAGSIATVKIRTEAPLPRNHGVRLHAVGPWRDDVGHRLIEIRLQRIGLHALAGAVRFPFAGRWRLDIAASSASPSFQRSVTVRRRPQRMTAAPIAAGQGGIVVTRTRPGLPRGCGPRGAASVLRGMFDAFTRGDRTRFMQAFFRPGVPGERFRWFAIYDGTTDVTLVTRAQLLRFLRGSSAAVRECCSG